MKGVELTALEKQAFHLSAEVGRSEPAARTSTWSANLVLELDYSSFLRVHTKPLCLHAPVEPQPRNNATYLQGQTQRGF